MNRYALALFGALVLAGSCLIGVDKLGLLEQTGPVQAIVVEESADRTPAHAAVILSPEVRGLVKSFRVIDDDQKVSPDLQPYLDAAKTKPLPVLYLVRPSGRIAYEGPLPPDVPATKALVQKFQGVKQ